MSSDDCRPSQNNCSRGGIGPFCSQDSEIGGKYKRECLNNAKKMCEEALKECIAAADAVKEEQMEFVPVEGYVPPGQEQFDNTNKHGILTVDGEFRDTTNDGLYLYDVMSIHAASLADCYYQAASDCRTVQCYCGTLKCEIPDGTDDSSTSDDDSGDDEDPYTTEYETNELSDAKLETSSEVGIPIELMYTRAFFPGNITWMGEVRTNTVKSTQTVVDKNTRTITIKTRITTNNVIDFNVGLCAGEVDSITRVWFDDDLVYSVDDPSRRPGWFTLKNGREAQKVSKRAALSGGFGRTPAYRGLAFVEVVGLRLDQFSSFPRLKFETIRNVSFEDSAFSSEEITGSDSSLIWHVDDLGKKLYIETATGVTCRDTRTLEEVWAEEISNPIEITPLGRVIANNTSMIEVYEPRLSVITGSVAASLPFSQSFLLRIPNMVGNAGLKLITQAVDGDTLVEEIDEVLPAFPTDSVAIQELPALDDTHHDIAILTDRISAQITGEEALNRSILLLRVGQDDAFNNITIRELRAIGNAGDSLLEDQAWYEHTISPVVFGNVNSLVLLGAFPTENGDVIIFTGDASGYLLIRFSVDNGVVWATPTIYTLPSMGRYAPVTRQTDEFSFIYGADVFTVDVEDGTVTPVALSGVVPTLAGKQTYLPDEHSLLYHATADTVARIDLQRATNTKETIRDALLDLMRRQGLSSTYVDVSDDIASTEITGYRSGNASTAAEIIKTLGDVYGFITSADDEVKVVNRSLASVATISYDDVETEPKKSRKTTESGNHRATVEYFSADGDGEPREQSVTRDIDPEKRHAEVTVSESWTILETDLLMRRVAERLVNSIEQLKVEIEVSLPPKYIGIAAGDAVTIGGATYRATKIQLGANDFVVLTMYLDDPSRYDEVVSLLALDWIENTASTILESESLAAPMGVSLKAINPVNYGRASMVYAGISDLDSSFDEFAYVASTINEFEPAPMGSLRALKSLVWGRVVSIPPAMLGSAEFGTFRSQSFSVEFPSDDMVDRILAVDNFYGLSPDYRTMDYFYNTLAVGNELIQYGYASAAGRIVTFHDLLRCRHNTDQFKNLHTVGEICILVDPDSCYMEEVPLENAGATTNMYTYSGWERERRFDVQTNDLAYNPLSPGYVMRKDVHTTVSPSIGTLVPVVRTELSLQLRSEKTQTFSNDRVDDDSIKGYLSDFGIYLLRAPYDAALFDAERYGVSTSTSYIFYRAHAVTERQIDFYGKTVVGAPWPSTSYTISTLWDYDTEPMWAVLTKTNLVGESRSITHFPAGLYTEGKTRGLLVNE